MTKDKKNKNLPSGNGGRPIIKVKFQLIEKIMIVIAVLGVALMWIYVFYNINKLPQMIPTHFAVTGKANSWGSKNTLFIMPIMSTITVAILIFITRFPRFFNYPVKITKENAEKQYRNSIRLMITLAIEIAITFNYIEYKIVGN